MKISACLIALNEENFIELSLRSLIQAPVDEIIVVDGGSTDRTLEIIDSLNSQKIKVFHNKWNGNYSDQRNFALKQATGEWILQLDCDEVLSDNSFLLKEYAKKTFIDWFDIKYEHFIYSLNTVDNTLETHFGLRRFFRNYSDVRYAGKMHELANTPRFRNAGIISDVIVFHLGYLKGIRTIMDKYEKNILDSPIHDKEFLDKWKNELIMGTYPTRKFTGEFPFLLKRFFKI